MQASASGLVINATTTRLAFLPIENELLGNFVMGPIPHMLMPTQEKFEALRTKGAFPVLYCRITKITVTQPNGYCTIIDTISDWGPVSVTMFGFFGHSLQTFQAGDKALFFNLVLNEHNGKTGLKFGNRTGMFRTNGVNAHPTTTTHSHQIPIRTHAKPTRLHVCSFSSPSSRTCRNLLQLPWSTMAPGATQTSQRSTKSSVSIRKVHHAITLVSCFRRDLRSCIYVLSS